MTSYWTAAGRLARRHWVILVFLCGILANRFVRVHYDACRSGQGRAFFLQRQRRLPRWRDGTSHVIFEPLELNEKLTVIVPPPRFNLVRCNGILAPSEAEGDAA